MKDTITDIFKFLIDAIFNFWTFMLVMTVSFIWIAVESSENDAKIKEQTRIATEACYAQGMVLVQSDAGPRCASPQSLVKVK